MRLFIHRHLVLSAALVIAATLCVSLGILEFFWSGQLPVPKILLAGLIVFAISYIMMRYVVNRFIYQKIKLIYKTINNLRSPRSDLRAILNEDSDVLETVNKEVISWAHNKQEEITVLREQEAYRREFLGNVSHELKTPIFNVQGYIHTLLDGGLEDEAINRKFLIRADKSVERLISVVEDLDVISQLESGRLDLNLQRINIVELAQEVMDMVEMKAEKRPVSVSFNEKYDKPIFVMADAHQIKQLYVNLLDNSIKYGSKNNAVKLRFFDMDRHILCEVADDGPGIAPEHLGRVFERFYRIDKARDRNAGGTGLGLSIVKHIIEAHGQTINVRSKVGKHSGTTFAFTLKKA